jgi:predicted RNase H-like HicB family nuclease/predicted transcriptional regulator
MLRVYPAVITKAEGEDYGVVFPDLPGCVTTGETIGEAAAMAIEALAGHVGTMIQAEEPLPEPAPLDTRLPDWLADIAGKVVAAPVLVPVEIPSRSVRINISLDDALLARLDRAAAAENETRSGFIARAVRELLNERQRKPQVPHLVAEGWYEAYSGAPREIGEAQSAIVREIEAALERKAAAREIGEEIAERVLRRFRGEAASTADQGSKERHGAGQTLPQSSPSQGRHADRRKSPP